MPKLTLTSTFASTIMVGDPGYLTIPLPPKETKAVDVTDVQLRQLTPGLEKLKAAGWLNYVVDAAGPQVTVTEAIKVDVKPIESPKLPPPPVPSPEPVIAPPVEPESVVADSATIDDAPIPETLPAPVPSAPKPGLFEKKNRNR